MIQFKVHPGKMALGYKTTNSQHNSKHPEYDETNIEHEMLFNLFRCLIYRKDLFDTFIVSYRHGTANCFHQGSWNVCCLHLKIEFRSYARGLVVWHLSLPMMNSFNKTEAAVFPCRLCFLRAYPIISLITVNHFSAVANLILSQLICI